LPSFVGALGQNSKAKAAAEMERVTIKTCGVVDRAAKLAE